MADNNNNDNKLINLGLLDYYDEKIKEYIEGKGYLTSAPVASVNGQTGAVTLTPTDIGAAPAPGDKNVYLELVDHGDVGSVTWEQSGFETINFDTSVELQYGGKEVATQDWVDSNEVFEKGDANNSGVLKGQSNQALSQASISLGKENLSGLKGWYYRGIRKVSDSIINVFLSNTQVLPKWDNATEDSDKTNLNPMEVLGKGTIVSLVNDSKYDNKFKISDGRAGMVQLRAIDENGQPIQIPFNSIKAETNLSPEDYTIYCLSKPDQGPADIGHYAFVTGRDNKAINVATAVFGTGNTANGKLAIVGGKNNEGGYNTVTFGAENVNNCDNAFVAGTNINNTGNNSFITGNKHTNKGKRAHVEGNNNQNNSTGMNNHIEGENNVIEAGTAANVHLAGIGNKTSTSNQTVVGRYNANNDNALFIVGNGQNATDAGRTNAFTVQQNGTATVGANPVNDMDVATKGWVTGQFQSKDNYIKNTGTKDQAQISEKKGLNVLNGIMIEGKPVATQEWVAEDYITNTREINGKPLSTDITLNGGDIALTGYNGQSQAVNITATDTVNSAIAKLGDIADEFDRRIPTGVDTSISDKTSTNLPTSKAVVDFVEGKEYQTAADVKAITVDNANNADNLDHIPASDYVKSGENWVDGDFELHSQGNIQFFADGGLITLNAEEIIVDGDLTIQPSASYTETNGSSKYLKICTIKTSYAHQDINFKFSIVGRSQKYQQVTVKLQTNAPAVLANYGILVSGHGGNVYDVQGYIFNKGAYDEEYVEIWCNLPAWDKLNFFKDIWSTNSESDTQLSWDPTEHTALPTIGATTIKIIAEPEAWQGTANRATQDGSGNTITSTYATKTALNNKLGYSDEEDVDDILTDYHVGINFYTDGLWRYNGTNYYPIVDSNNFSEQQAFIDLKSRVSALEGSICLQEGTQILMANGTSKNIEDITYGDMIMTYDIDNNETIPCKSYGSLFTGYTHTYNHYCFDNGSILRVFGGHRLYDADKQELVYFSKMNIGDHAMTPECVPATYCYSPTKVPAAVSTRKFTLFCETGLYFANNILCGHPLCQPLDLHIRTYGAVKLSEEDKATLQAYADARDNDYQVELSNPEYVKEAMSIWQEQQIANRKIAECKEKLAARDYKTIKAMQGKLAEEELIENINVCEELRSMVNFEEGIVANNKAQIKALQNKYNIYPRKLQVMETTNVKDAIAKARVKYRH